MKNVCLCLYLLSASGAFSQAKKNAPARATASPLARICQDPYQVREPAEGWPEAPVRVLFHREKSKAPWSANPAIRLAGLEAATAAGAKTLICVEESQIEMGHYDSGEPAYAPSWSVTLVRISDRKAYSVSRGLSGGMPPDIKWQKGAGVGRLPTDIFVRWMRLVLDQKVARLKMRLKSKGYHQVSAMAFSGDGARLAVAQEPYRSSSEPNPPTPISVFDLATGQPGLVMHADYSVTEMALSKSGSTIATERYGHVEIWDAASGNVTQKLETKKVGSLLFGPGDTLGVAGDETAQVWDIAGNRVLHSAVGSGVQLSSEDAWMAISSSKDGVKVRDLESGRELSAFPRAGERDQYAVSRDGRAMARYTVRDAFLYIPGNPQAQPMELPNLSFDMPTAVAATRDGFVVGNSDGFVGMVSGAAPKPRAFATGFTGIKACAVSSDGKLIAVGDSGGSIEIWELR